MKYLLVLAVVLIAIGIWRSNRSHERPPPAPRSGRKDDPQAIEMVRCDVCGVHCPSGDALHGKHGVYCSAQHRSQAES